MFACPEKTIRILSASFWNFISLVFAAERLKGSKFLEKIFWDNLNENKLTLLFEYCLNFI